MEQLQIEKPLKTMIVGLAIGLGVCLALVAIWIVPFEDVSLAWSAFSWWGGFCATVIYCQRRRVQKMPLGLLCMLGYSICAIVLLIVVGTAAGGA